MALLGAAGGIGQPLGLLLKMNRLIAELSLYDLAPFTKGVAKDLSHCNTNAKVPCPPRRPVCTAAERMLSPCTLRHAARCTSSHSQRSSSSYIESS